MMAIDRRNEDPPLRREDARPPLKAPDDLRATPFTEDVFDDEYYGRRRRGGLSFGLVALVIFGAAAAAVVGWYVFGTRATGSGPVTTGPGGVPLVKADTTPYKVKPDNPGGMQVADQDKLIYERVEKGTPPKEVENLLPPPEVPKEPPTKPEAKMEVVQNAPPPVATQNQRADQTQTTPPPKSEAAANGPDKSQTKMTPISPLPPPAESPSATTSSPAAASGPAGAPATAQADSDQASNPTAPDNTSETSEAGEHTASDPLAKMVAEATGGHVAANGDVVAPAPPVGSTSTASSANSPMTLIPNGASSAASTAPLVPAQTMVVAPPVPTAPVPAPVAAAATVASAAPGPSVIGNAAEPPPPAGAGVYVQLASTQSEEGAFDEWKRISGRNKDLLGALSPAVSRADIADKGTYYRLRAGPLPDRTAAENLCAALEARHVGCLLVRP